MQPSNHTKQRADYHVLSIMNIYIITADMTDPRGLALAWLGGGVACGY
eukprot:COSAG01_NODE_14579_length_1436_cov_1.131638_3_plen_48_part_00